MAYAADHRNDTSKAIASSTTEENVEILRELVHVVVDGQATTNGKNECANLLQKLEKKGIVTIDELYDRFLKEGVDKAAINNYDGGSKERFLVDWLLPPHGPSHQLYTHKGWDYDYSQEDDKDYWNAIDIKQSWEVKKYLLEKTVEKIYSVSQARAKAISVLLYNVHRLRDIQFNEYSPKKNYLLNTCDEIAEYVLQEIDDKNLRSQVHDLIGAVQKKQAELTGPITDDFWKELNEPIDKLIGSIGFSENGLVSRVLSELTQTL